MAGWDGDISHMGQLARNVGKLAMVPSRAAKAVSAGISDLIEEEFEQGTDPYGRAWQPLTDATLEKRSQTVEPPLTDYGEMRRALEVRPMRGSGVAITIPHPAEDHQTGWSGSVGAGPARPVLPDGPMPARWAEVVSVAVGREVDAVLKGVA